MTSNSCDRTPSPEYTGRQSDHHARNSPPSSTRANVRCRPACTRKRTTAFHQGRTTTNAERPPAYGCERGCSERPVWAPSGRSSLRRRMSALGRKQTFAARQQSSALLCVYSDVRPECGDWVESSSERSRRQIHLRVRDRTANQLTWADLPRSPTVALGKITKEG
jgi:hypothetical protein